MLEPPSTRLFVLLMVVFGGLIWWLLVTRQPVLRLLAACLAFVPAMLFGVVAVNKYGAGRAAGRRPALKLTVLTRQYAATAGRRVSHPGQGG